MNRLVLVAVLGAAGTLLRLLVGEALTRPATAFPWGTFVVNVVGCLLIGVVYTITPANLPQLWRTSIGVGLLGGLTTFSSFAFDALRLSDAGRPGLAVTYVGASVATGLVAVWLGATVVRGI
jgi:CrcB protein